MYKFIEMQIVTPWAKPSPTGTIQDQYDVNGKPIEDFMYDGASLAHIMKRGSPEALCFDIRSNIKVTLGKGQQARIPTGVHIAMPGHMGALMRERSGLAHRGLRLGAGTLDADYRGEYLVLLRYEPLPDVLEPYNIPDMMVINRGDRIAQIYFTPEDPSALRWKIVSSKEDLPKSYRGVKGFGSSGMGSHAA